MFQNQPSNKKHWRLTYIIQKLLYSQISCLWIIYLRPYNTHPSTTNHSASCHGIRRVFDQLGDWNRRRHPRGLHILNKSLHRLSARRWLLHGLLYLLLYGLVDWLMSGLVDLLLLTDGLGAWRTDMRLNLLGGLWKMGSGNSSWVQRVWVKFIVEVHICDEIRCLVEWLIVMLGIIGLIYKIWGFAWWKSVSSRFAVTPCVISTIAKLRYRFWKEPNRTTRISTVAKWEIWFRENHGDFTGSSLRSSPDED